ncbi:inner membrane protein [Salmonella bongori]|nr:inner membrane protein [Salmonella bongori]
MWKSPRFMESNDTSGAIILLLIPLMMVRQAIVARADYRNDEETDIRQSIRGPQKAVGPLVAIPVTELLYRAGK